jgi:hypothetical protein
MTTEELLRKIEANFGVEVLRQGSLIAKRMGIASRPVCRDLVRAEESPRPGHTNPELAAGVLRQALDAAGLAPDNLS